jgi:hypothetical protein
MTKLLLKFGNWFFKYYPKFERKKILIFFKFDNPFPKNRLKSFDSESFDSKVENQCVCVWNLILIDKWLYVFYRY